MDFLLKRFELNKNKIAFIYNNKTFNYKWFIERIEYYCEFLEEKLLKDKVIFFKTIYSPDSIALFLALVKLKNTIIPFIGNDQKIDLLLDISKPDFVIQLDTELSVNELNYDNSSMVYNVLKERSVSGLVLFSSGTTGDKKAVLHDFDKLIDKYHKTRKDLSTIVFMYFDHIGGIDTLFYCLSNSSTIGIPNERTPENICKLIEEYKIEVLPTTPTFLNLIILSEVYKKHDITSLKYVTYGTEVMPEVTLKKINEILPNTEIIQKFGATEVGTLGSKSENSNSLWMKLGGFGFETRIVNSELQIKANSAMVAYLNAPSPFTDDGWYKTGDLVDEKDGYIKILGRKTNIINVGGEKVNPNEVENIIRKLDFIEDVIVYSEKNPIMGNIIVCDLKINNIDQIEAKKIVKQHCKENLLKFQIPVKFNFIDSNLFNERFKLIRNK